MSDKRIVGLDGIRAIAVILVFSDHSSNLAHTLDLGVIGVWAFFVLSGFLIVRILHAQRLQIETGQDNVGGAWLKFFYRRTLRIFPIYYLVLGIAAVMALYGPVRDYSTTGEWPYYWSYLTNIYIQISGHFPGSFSHLWSLAVEEQFYLLAAPAFLLLPSRSARPICIALIIVGIAWGVAMGPVGRYVDSVFSFYMLALGGLAGLSVSRVESKGELLSAAAALFAGSAAVDFGLSGAIKHAAFLFPAFAAILYVYIFQRQDAVLVRALDCWPLRNLGRISYGFYLYHNFLRIEWIFPLFGVGFEPSNKMRVAIEFLITLAVAIASWFVIERPLLSLKRFDALAKLWTPSRERVREGHV